MSMDSVKMLMCLSGRTSSLHNEFDNFKQSHKEQTKRGYSMFPLNELLNNERETPSPQIILFRKTYLHLEANEIVNLYKGFSERFIIIHTAPLRDLLCT